MIENWEKEKSNWFVMDPNSIDQKREPGLLKEEFSIREGSAVFLSPKCYSMSDNDQNMKTALKEEVPTYE